MANGHLMMRALVLLLLLGSAQLWAQPISAPTATAPADPVLSARCRAIPTAFGCANAANLQAMARASDLVAGQPLSPAPGGLEAAAVGRLLEDKVKDLRREGTGRDGGGGQ